MSEPINTDLPAGKDAGLDRAFFENIIETRGGGKIIRSPEYTAPTIDIQKFGEDSDHAELAVDVLTRYANFPIIEDNFPNHNERRAWRNTMEKELQSQHGPEAATQFSRTLQENKMKQNKIWAVSFYIESLSPYISKEVAERTTEIIDQITKHDPETDTTPWNGPTTPEKIQTVNELSDLAKRALSDLEVYKPGQQ